MGKMKVRSSPPFYAYASVLILTNVFVNMYTAPMKGFDLENDDDDLVCILPLVCVCRGGGGGTPPNPSQLVMYII